VTLTRKCRCVRFSLRTLFVLVTLFAIWLGWNIQIVRRRSATRAALLTVGCEIDDEGTFPGRVAPQQAQIPLARQLLGDRAIWGISFSPTCSRELIDRFDRDFPETPEAFRVY
jgi:hypothetical protein